MKPSNPAPARDELRCKVTRETKDMLRSMAEKERRSITQTLELIIEAEYARRNA